MTSEPSRSTFAALPAPEVPLTATTVSAPLDVRMVLTLNGALVLILGILPGGLMSLCADAIMRSLSS